jgi:hypothetical protein
LLLRSSSLSSTSALATHAVLFSGITLCGGCSSSRKFWTHAIREPGSSFERSDFALAHDRYRTAATGSFDNCTFINQPCDLGICRFHKVKTRLDIVVLHLFGGVFKLTVFKTVN